MLFNSLEFLVFFVVVWSLYALARQRVQNWLLLLASYVFYGAWDYRFLALLIATTIVDYYVGVALGRQQSALHRKRLIAVSIVANLGVLATFKYCNFFADNFSELLGLFGLSVSPFSLQVILPVGVSFYTFQSMSYTIDVYRRKLEPCRDLRDFALFVAFFPQLVAGPIERASTLLPQITGVRHLSMDKIGSGLCLVILGFYKKVVMADNLAPTVDAIFGKQGGYTMEDALLGMLLFAFQIYGDFSGYSDIARGTSRMLGFELMVNFRQPYLARSPSDFWRRWHISLSTWLRDYLYLSLGGNRGSKLQTYRNLMLTMILGGLWHGAAWNYVWWGIYHGSLLVIYRIRDDMTGRTSDGTAPTGVTGSIVATAVMFAFTLYGWLLFRANSGHQIVQMTGALFDFRFSGMFVREMARLVLFAWPVVLLDYLNYRSGDPEPILLRAPVAVQALSYAGLLLMFIVMGQYEGATFIYFQF